jgi:hypothetical protein
MSRDEVRRVRMLMGYMGYIVLCGGHPQRPHEVWPAKAMGVEGGTLFRATRKEGWVKRKQI